MRNHAITTYFLLGYLALLLNVGPSAHHADIFGLHGDSCCHDQIQIVDHDSSCCCDTSDSDTDGSESTKEADLSSRVRIDSSVEACCDACILCQYFDQLNAVDSSFAILRFEAFVSVGQNPKSLLEPNQFIDCTARGPPSISLG